MDKAFAGFIVGVMVMTMILVYTGNRRIDGYKEGQIDAINGKIAYQLVEQPNHTTTWEKVKGVE